MPRSPWLTFMLVVASARLVSADAWHLVISDDLSAHGAVRIGIQDLKYALIQSGHILNESPSHEGEYVIRVALDTKYPDTDGFSWETRGNDICLTARDARAIGYGLCRLAWLTCAENVFPPDNRTEAPELPFRLYAWNSIARPDYEGPATSPDDIEATLKRFRSDLAHIIRLGYNYLVVFGLEHFVPWDDPHYGPRAIRYQVHLKPIIAEAHAHGVKVLLGGDEAVFLPSHLEKHGAKASVKDPLFWQAMQDKYRRLFSAAPELDGIVTRTGEQQPCLDFRHVDIVHHPDSSPDPRSEERYASFLKAIYDVVAREQGKLFVHRTWAIGDWGQHSVPDLLARSVPPDLPTENFLLSIKTTKQDQWYYGSAFNPTFGVTAYASIVEGELHNQYHGGGQLMDYPAVWLGSAMQFARLGGAQGIFARQANPEGVLPYALLYLWSRLAWNTSADIFEITREWTAHEFGAQAATPLATLLLQSAPAIQHTFYLRPFLTIGWNALPLIRTNQFIAEGNPLFDSGKGHDTFLRRHYLMCKPYFAETYTELGEGCEIAENAYCQFQEIRNLINPPEAAQKLNDILDHTRDALALIRDYYRAFLSYGAYRDISSESNRDRLDHDIRALEVSMAAYQTKHSYYKLDGASILCNLAHAFLGEPDSAQARLEQAPTPEALRTLFLNTHDDHTRQIIEAGDHARKIVSWSGTVDFRMMVHFQEQSSRHEVLRGMAPGSPTATFEQPIPQQNGGKWLLKPLAAPEAIYLFEFPKPENDYTLSVYIDEASSGGAFIAFDIYWIPPE